MGVFHATIPPPGTVGAIDQPQWAQAHVVDAGGITFNDGSLQFSAAPGPGSLANAILADTPFAYWKCTDASAGFVDSSGNGFALTTSTGSISYQITGLVASDPSTFAIMGTIGGSAGNNNLNLNSQLGQTYPLANWSVECVVSTLAQASTNNFRIVDLRPSGSGSAVLLLFSASPSLEIFTGVTNVLSSSVLASPDARAFHIVVTASTAAGTTTYKIYANGVLAGSATHAADSTSGNNMVVTIGGWGGNVSSPFAIGHVALYNTALSPARVAVHASAAGL